MGFFIQNYQRFSGNAAQLADVALDCAQKLSLPGDNSKISERLIRYYVTEGLLSRPIRIGRDAEYQWSRATPCKKSLTTSMVWTLIF
jgi:hypothetical protein